MVDFKLVISDPKTGKSHNKEIKDEKATQFLNLKIGDQVKGDLIDMAGYEFRITGGSDNCGFPMRKDVNRVRKKILAVEGVGVRKKNEGIRQRKTVCGGKINASIVQINLKVIKHGKDKLGEDAEAGSPEEEIKKGKQEKEAPKKELVSEEKSKEYAKADPKAVSEEETEADVKKADESKEEAKKGQKEGKEEEDGSKTDGKGEVADSPKEEKKEAEEEK